MYLYSNIPCMDTRLLDPRQERGLAIAANSRIKQIVESTWLVPSQTTTGGYVVDSQRGTCTCPDHELRGTTVTCKHRWAVEFARHRVANPDGTQQVVSTMRVTYTQNWPAYSAAQCAEKQTVELLLRDLLQGVQNPPRVGRGRPRACLADVIFAGAVKIYSGMSGRRATSDVRSCRDRGIVGSAPAYNTVFDYLDREDLTPVLKRLIQESAAPLAAVESQFAIDSSGFSTSVYRRWYDAKYGKQVKEAGWVKLHCICGANTQVITAAEVTGQDSNDCPQLPGLLQETTGNFAVQELSADKGYLSRANVEAITAAGAQPFIAFKVNSHGQGPESWRRAYHLFSFHRQEWLAHYHQRSNVESLFSSIKRKFGAAVRSKTHRAMVNEVLLKCLVHNLCCLVQAMYELGITPEFEATRRAG
jgi:transposase